MNKIKLTEDEIKWCTESPEILKLLAHINDCKATEEQAIDPKAGQYYIKRQDELNERVRELKKQYYGE